MPPINEIVETDKEDLDAADADENQEIIEGELIDDHAADKDDADDVIEGETDDVDAEVSDEVVVTIDGEEPPQAEDAKAPQWVKDLRKSQRELQRQNRDLQKKLEQAEKTGAPKTEPVGKRPSLDEFDYDTEKYEAALDGWYKRKQAAEQADREASTEEAQRQQAWTKRLGIYEDSKKQLRVQNFAEAEASVFSALDVTQQGIIVQGADNPAAIVYALNHHPTRLAELAAMKDPVQFAVAIGKLETKLKMTPRTQAPPPEKRIRGSGTGKGNSMEATLDKLRAKAEETGDYTEVTRHKAKMKKQQA